MANFVLQIVMRLFWVLAGNALGKAAPNLGQMSFRQLAGSALIVAAMGLAMTGRVALALVAGVIGLALAGWGGSGRGQRRGSATGPRQRSSVRTAFLLMHLDHATGAMTGQVLAGSLAGRELGSLGKGELQVLWRECRAGEPQSRQLLEAYLDRALPEWREELRQEEAAARSPGAAGSARMSRKEALEVLGLSEGADAAAVKAAHRELMKRFHPDQGGTNYLATKINEAKDVLLGKA